MTKHASINGINRKTGFEHILLGIWVVALAFAGLSGCTKKEEPEGKTEKGTRPGPPIGQNEQKPGVQEPVRIKPDSVSREYDQELIAQIGSKVQPVDAGRDKDNAGLRTITVQTWDQASRKRISYHVELDLRQQVLRLDVPQDKEMSRRDRGGSREAPLHPSLASLRGSSFVSAAMLAFKAKQFDDGLYAAVELAADKGAGDFPSRDRFLADLLMAVLKSSDEKGKKAAAALLHAASELGRLKSSVPPEVASESQVIKNKFLGDPLRSKPLGFYTWTRKLFSVFQRDRLLQTPVKPDPAGAMARAIAGNENLQKSYEAMLDLPSRLTNKLAWADLRKVVSDLKAKKNVVIPRKVSLIPASRAYETDLIKKLFGDSPIPDGFDLSKEMIKRIRAKTLSLEPKPDSGWYDHQTWALEPLVVPDRTAEATHLRFSDTYKKELAELFRALLALTRETHIKQLEVPMVGSAARGRLRVSIYPELTQEPLATHYLRRALAYRFVRSVLERSFGKAGLSGMRRLTASGPINLTLDRELTLMEDLFYGAYLVTCRQIGLGPVPHAKLVLGSGPQAALLLYKKWHADKDPDVAKDVRMMVPVFYDIGRRKLKVWAVLGVAQKKLSVSFDTPPTVLSIESSDKKPVPKDKIDFSFHETYYRVAYPVMAEVYTNKLLDRDEFRRLCDKHRTRKAILEQLR